MALLAQDKKDEAINEMKAYLKQFPKDAEAGQLLQAMETGNIEREIMKAK